MKLKLNAYVEYVVAVVAYGCQVWYASKTYLLAPEKLQKSAIRWVIGTNEKYKERLIKLKIQQLSLYFELQFILLLYDLIDGRYDINITHHISLYENNRK